MFNAEVKIALSSDLDKSHVKSRSQSGRNLSYIEGWWAIAEANRIFGFDGWQRDTVFLNVVSEKERKVGTTQRDGWGVTYVCKVRITVGDVIRDGTGAGHGIDVDLGSAHESAIKEAETDAMKRALMTFGWPFGLALYDKSQEHVSDTPVKRTPQETFSVNDSTKVTTWTGPLKVTALKEALRALSSDLKSSTDKGVLAGIWADNKAVVDQAEYDLPDWHERLQTVLMDAETALESGRY